MDAASVWQSDWGNTGKQPAAPLSQASGAAAFASAGNRARVTSMATMYSATKPLMLLQILSLGVAKLS